MKGYPTYNEIVNDYKEVYELIKDIKTIEQLKSVDWTETEVNGYRLGELKNMPMQDIEWFRFESYKNIDYIYVCFNDKREIDLIYFDVWCSKYGVDFIEGMSINDLTYEEYCKAIVDIETYMEELRGEN